MPSFVKPEWVSISTNSSYSDCMQHYIAYTDETVTYDDETMTRADFIKNVLFSGKYNDKITFEYCGKGSIDTEGSQGLFGMFLDKANNDRAALYACKHTGYNPAKITGDVLFSPVYKVSDYLSLESSVNNFPRWFQVFGTGTTTGTMRFMSYNTFVVIEESNSSYSCVFNSLSYRVVLLYDFTNHECIMFDIGLRYISMSKPNQFSYVRPLTYDGYYMSSGEQIRCFPYIRESSNSEVTYCKLKMLDGTEATRVYMLTKFPVNAANSILTVGNKKLYVLTNASNNGCALAIDCAADIAS